MLREQQIMHNEKCLAALKEIDAMQVEGSFRSWQRLNYSQAEFSSNWYGITVLRSYNTIVAMYDDETGIGYNFSRYVYGYTATTTQHISKFFKKFQPILVYTWRKV